MLADKDYSESLLGKTMVRTLSLILLSLSISLCFAGKKQKSAHEKACLKSAQKEIKLVKDEKLYKIYSKDYCACSAYYHEHPKETQGYNKSLYCLIETTAFVTADRIEEDEDLDDDDGIDEAIVKKYCLDTLDKVTPKAHAKMMDKLAKPICSCLDSDITRLYNDDKSDDMSDDEYEEAIEDIAMKCTVKHFPKK